MNFAWRIYRWLARAFPHEFKLAYGTEVVQLGEDVVADIAQRHGAAGLIRLIADIATRVRNGAYPSPRESTPLCKKRPLVADQRQRVR